MTLSRKAGWSGVFVLGIALAAMAIRTDWLGVTVLGSFFAISVALLLLRSRIPAQVALFFIVAAMLNAAGYLWDLYKSVTFFDELSHAYSSFAVTINLAHLLLRKPAPAGRRGLVVSITAMGLAIGLVWEVFEYFVGILGNNGDTVSDLFLDGCGALTAGLMGANAVRSTPPVNQLFSPSPADRSRGAGEARCQSSPR